MSSHVLIIGAGPAGLAAAEAASGRGARVTLCGTEPYPPYWRPRLTHFLSAPVEADKLLIRKPEWYVEHGIELKTGMTAESVCLERKVAQWADGSKTTWDGLVLATGSTASVPAVVGAEHAMTLRTYDDAVQLRKSALASGQVTIVGGGLLGLEAAWELNAAGVSTTLIERNQWLMPRQLNRTGGEFLKRKLEQAGLTIVIGRDPSSMGELYADRCVILCAGVQANLSAIAGTGIQTGRAIVVDDQMKTSADGVYACGDVAEYNGRSWGLLPVAQEQGKVAGANAAGGDAVYVETPPSPMLKIGAVGVFSVGSVAEGEGILSLSEQTEDSYACVMLRDGVISGAVLAGNTAMGMKLKKAVGEKRVFSGIQNLSDVFKML